jgi:hypothetical protein
MRFFYSNEIDDESYTFDPRTENPSYPIENVRDYQLSKQYWTTSETDQWIVIDAGVGNTITATIAYIAGHNLTSTANFIKIQGSATAAWYPPTFSDDFTWSSGVMQKSFASQAFRYWRFFINDSLSPDATIKIGRLGLGTYFDLTNWADTGFTRRIVDTSSVEKSVTGQDYGDERITYFEYDFTFPYLTNAERILLETMYQSVKRVKPVLFIANPSDTTLLPLYCTISRFEITHKIAWEWTGSMTLMEAL